MIFEDQQHQKDCVARILESLAGIEFSFDRKDKIDILHKNLAKIANEHNYPVFDVCDKWKIDVQMETGTGKTFTYLNTIYELHQKFGQNKFIIVLPRTAIKLGVIQNIKLTDEYFFGIYKKHLNIINYPQDGLATIRNEFINSPKDLSILIINNSAFNSESNNINKRKESLLKYDSTWDGIAKQKPVVIIDEPHLLKGGRTEEWLGKLTDSLLIRFGATFPTDEQHQLSNVGYALDSISSFNQQLVKEIGVNTIFANSEQSTVHVHNIKHKDCFDIYYNINKQLHKKTIHMHDDIGGITGLSQFKNHVVTKITKSKIFFANGQFLDAYKGGYKLSDDEIKGMISATITLHFENEQRYFEKGIKTLSLFFIPNVADFRGTNPRIKNIFEEKYRDKRKKIYLATTNVKYKEFLDKDFSKDGKRRLLVHEGYFSGDRGTKDDKEAAGVDIILNKKEELLSFDTPLRFIFSVWALQEGWDNPNIFNICKLSSTAKEISRRQQVGRGLRIAVNQQGKRLTYKHVGESNDEFYDINTLNMVVSVEEQHFVDAIQNEVAEASYSLVGDTITMNELKRLGMTENEVPGFVFILQSNGIIKYNEKNDNYAICSSIEAYMKANRAQFSFLGDDRFKIISNLFNSQNRNAVKDANKKRTAVKVSQPKWEEFKELWETINKKSKIVYKDIVEDKILEEVASLFSKENILPGMSMIKREKYNAQTNEVEQVSVNFVESTGYFIKNSMSDYAIKFAQDEKYPLAFILKLFNQLDINKFVANPSKSGDFIRAMLKDTIHKEILQSVSYNFCETAIYPNVLQDESGKLIEQLKEEVIASLGKYDSDRSPPAEFLYDTVMYDSNIEKESIVNDPMELDNNKIIVFAKLPPIKIPTPYKTYNPDFAYLIDTGSDKRLFLVVETKGYKYNSNISPEEQQKIEYAKNFFAALQKEFPSINIRYKTRINKQELSKILRELNV